MVETGSISPGGYQDGNSYFHRLDPRLKIILLIVLIACLFSATTPARLSLLFLLWLVAASSCSNFLPASLKLFKFLRWLLLFTLLLHLFFTPGRTLFGTSWLSYDGLLRGLVIDSQLLLAVFFSSILAWSTRPELLAWGLAALLAPLRFFKVPVRETGGLFVLVLQFIPLIQAELLGLKETQPNLDQPWFGKIKSKMLLVAPLIYRLVDRADELAQEIAAHETPFPHEVSPLQDRHLTQFDWVLFSFVLLILLLLWVL